MWLRLTNDREKKDGSTRLFSCASTWIEKKIEQPILSHQGKMFFNESYWTETRAQIKLEAGLILKSYERLLAANTPEATLNLARLLKDAANIEAGKLIEARKKTLAGRLQEVVLMDAETTAHAGLGMYRLQMQMLENDDAAFAKAAATMAAAQEVDENDYGGGL
jgi:hypothetical protein